MGYAFFADIIKYIRKYELSEESRQSIDDLSIINALNPNRFLILDDDVRVAPNVYYMQDAYRMPDHFEQIKYTDFKIQFLTYNDPLLAASTKGGMEVDSSEELKAIWIYFKKHGRNKNVGIIRTLFGKDDSIKDIALRDIVCHLDVAANSSKSPSVSTSSLSSLTIDEKKEENEKKDDDEKSEEDILFEDLLKTGNTFHFLSSAVEPKAIPLKVLERKGLLFDTNNTSNIVLVVMMPKKKDEEVMLNKKDKSVE